MTGLAMAGVDPKLFATSVPPEASVAGDFVCVFSTTLNMRSNLVTKNTANEESLAIFAGNVVNAGVPVQNTEDIQGLV